MKDQSQKFNYFQFALAIEQFVGALFVYFSAVERLMTKKRLAKARPVHPELLPGAGKVFQEQGTP